MKLADLALGQRDDGDACELQTLVERSDIGLIAADPVQCFSHKDVELAVLRIAHQPLDARSPDRARSGYCRILVGTDDHPPLPLRMLPAKTELVLNRRSPLVVGGIAGVHGSAGHDGGVLPV